MSPQTPRSTLFPYTTLFRSNLFNNLIQRNQSAAFSSGKVRPNHETNINIIARRTGKDVNSHTVLPRTPGNNVYVEIGRAVQQECRDRYRMPSSARKKQQHHARSCYSTTTN